MECVFCRIINGEIPAVKVYEDERTVAIMDIMPSSPGHTLILTKRHYLNILELPEKELDAVALATQRIAHAVMKGIKPDGFNIQVNTNEAAGQVVPHFHLHIIPRYIKSDYIRKKLTDSELKHYAEMIRKEL